MKQQYPSRLKKIIFRDLVHVFYFFWSVLFVCVYDTAGGFKSGGFIWMMYGPRGQVKVLAHLHFCAEDGDGIQSRAVLALR